MNPKALSLCLALVALPAAAAELSEDLFLGDLPTVLTASRIEQPAVDAPAPVTVVDRATILASGFTEVQDILRLVPGFLVADWPRGGAVVTNHGLGDPLPRRLLVLIDGFSMLDAAFGTLHWEDLPIHVEDIERVEVVRGPNQASYGAKAYQGVVNIITRRAGEDSGGGLVAAYGEHAFDNLYVHQGRRGERLDWRIGASTRQVTNFRDLAQDGYEFQERLRRRTLNAQLAFRPGRADELRAVLGYSDGEDRVGGTFDGDAYPDHERRNRNLYLQLGWHRDYGAGSELALRYSHQQRREREAYLFTYGPLASPVDYDVDTWRDDLEFQQVHAFGDALKGIWGLGLRRDQAESERYLNGLGRVESRQWQLFGNLDWRPAPAWLLHAGGMLEDYDDSDRLFSPRLALNYQIRPNQGVRVSAGRGYRAPSLLEETAREAFVYKGAGVPPVSHGSLVDLGLWSDGSVRPERLGFFEIGYNGEFADRRLKVDARLFQEHHDDYINSTVCGVSPLVPGSAQDPCPFPAPPGYLPVQQWLAGDDDKAYLFVNAGSNRVRGLDVTLDWQSAELGRFLFAYAITRIRSDIDDRNTRQDAAESAPLHAASLLWSRGFGHGIEAALGIYYVGAMKWMGGGDEQPAYTRVDLRLAKRFGAGNEVALVARNLNGDHVEFRDSSHVERQAFVTLRLGW